MSGSLTHPPSKIMKQLLIDLTIGTSGVTADWAVFLINEPDSPDESITVYDTANILQGTAQPTGEIQELHGVQIRIRAATYTSGWTIANLVVTKFDMIVNQTIVTVSSTSYNVHSVDRTSGPLSIGKEIPNSKRSLFTVNALMSIRQLV